MREPTDGASKPSKTSSSATTFPLILDIDDFKGDFSFDALFGNLVGELLSSFKLEEAEADDGEPNGHIRVSSDAAKYSSQAVASSLFPGVEKLLSLFKDSCKELFELRKEIDGRLYNLKKDVSVQDSKHRKTLSEYLMEFNSSPCDLMELSPLFSDDSRVAGCFGCPEITSFAEEDIGRHGILVPSAMGNATASRGLEVAVANLQEYCNAN